MNKKYLSQEKNAIEKPGPEKESKKISRREFLKYGVGVAAVAAGATVLMGGLPIPTGATNSSQTKATSTSQSRATSKTPLVVMVKGDELTVMNGNDEVVVKDADLASAIAAKME